MWSVAGGQRPRIVLFGLFGAGNLGNDATLAVTLEHLRRRCPDAEILCICDKLPEFASAYEVGELPLDPLPPKGRWRIGNRYLRHAYVILASFVTEPLRVIRVRRYLKGTNELVIVGTGILDDFGALPWEMPAWLLRWCRGAKNVGASLHLLAVGAGPIQNPVNRFLMKRVVCLADRRSYRDTVSREFLGEIGINTSGDQVVPDLVFGLSQDGAGFDRNPESPPRVIGVGVMEYFGWSDDERRGRKLYRDYIEKMGRFVVWLLERGYEVRLLVGQLPSDERAVRDLRDAVSNDQKADGRFKLVAEPIRSLEDLFAEIMRTDAVVATRFHNLICALVLGRPVISIGYATKFDALMKDVGLGSYCQDIEKLDVDLLIRQFLDFTAAHATASVGIRSRTAEYRKAVERLYDSTFGSRALKH